MVLVVCLLQLVLLFIRSLQVCLDFIQFLINFLFLSPVILHFIFDLVVLVDQRLDFGFVFLYDVNKFSLLRC